MNAPDSHPTRRLHLEPTNRVVNGDDVTAARTDVSAPASSDPFERMVREQYALLCAYAFRHVRSRDVAEDIVQDVLFRIWKARSTIDLSDPLPYLLRAVRNETISRFRRHRWESPLEAACLPDIPPASVTDAAEEADLIRALNGALDELGPRSKEVFRLSRDEGLSYREIAERLGISIKTVETLMGRSLRALRLRAARFLGLVISIGIGAALTR
jgi:RNA polymerase sigma-70 factor (ECF subfamily)